MDENTTIAYVNSVTGAPVGRITMQDDHDAPCTWQGPHDYMSADGVTVRTVWAGRFTSDDWYATEDASEHDKAWRRISEGENAEGLGQYVWSNDESVELFTRYMRVFHPLVPVVDQWVSTGYSQGDSVRLIAWADREPTTGPAYLWASAMHTRIGQTLDFIGAFARGQFVRVAYESLYVDHHEFDAGEDEVTMSVSWYEDDSLSGVMYMEEFEPAREALVVAEDSLEIPEDCVIVPVNP